MTEKLKNEKLSPWIPGIIDTMVGARLLQESHIPHRNRLAVILLDSALETACRAFLNHRKKIRLTDAHKNRDNLISTVKTKIGDIDDIVWDVLNFNYTEIRCHFYHESAAKTITDDAFLDYKESIEFVIDRLLDIKSDQMVKSQVIPSRIENTGETEVSKFNLSEVHKIESSTDKLIFAINSLAGAKNSDEVNDFFKRAGERLKFSRKDFSNIMAKNNGTKKFFYFNKGSKTWELSGLGQFKLSQIKEVK